ncbi:MAG TPA: prepilin-type N-terminal cleavage/methylation domain-containing protein [Rickettsiales bacterium]|nr:prepilin-type N-terminal cleavage/methylation domain-containing protein [Rickettsiales bacterium]
MCRRSGNIQAFTLIELSIVLVIIGLIVGGILTGQDLINAAQTRAQIAQIEKYSTAARTFQNKYGYLPGDIPNPAASNFGFAARGQYAGEGDGNGLIEGIWGDGAGNNWGVYQTGGETSMFWVDLSKAVLIDGSFTTASPTTATASPVTGSQINNYLPQAKIQGNDVLVYGFPDPKFNSNNFFAIGGITGLDFGNANSIVLTPALSVLQAYNIDKKVDDGYPQTGTVMAILKRWGQDWIGASGTTATPASATTCYDNGNTGGATQKYSVGQNGGNGLNCALSMRMQ